MSAHAPWSPSSLGVTVHCNGHIEMTKDLPDEQHEAAKEGRAVHQVAEDFMRKGILPEPGGLVDAEGIRHAVDYANLCTSINGEHHIEEKVQCKRIHAVDCWGTPDHWVLCPDNMTLYVTDLKYGRSLVTEYWQLQAYASGIIDQLELQDTQLRVCLRIYQPRAWHPEGSLRVWEGPATDLRTPVNQMWNACNGPLSLSSGSHCKFCKARLMCPANTQAAMNAIDVTGYPVNKEQVNQGRELEIMRRAAEVINNRLAALESDILQQITSGKAVDGWAIGNGRSSKIWKDDPATVITMGELLGVDLRSTKPITPTQAKKAGVSTEVIDSLSKMIPGKSKLVRSTETLAYNVFSKGV
jgi:hypothetical protein